MQTSSDHLHNEVVQSVSMTHLTHNISAVLDDLPAHFVDDAVSLQMVNVDKISAWQNLFKQCQKTER